jgi:hypothetical protein
MMKTQVMLVHFTIKFIILGLKPKLQCLISKLICSFAHIGYKMMGHKLLKPLSKVARVKTSLQRLGRQARRVPLHPHIKQEDGASSP